MEAATAPEVSEAELEVVGPTWDAFQKIMEDTVLDSDLVRIDWLLEHIAEFNAEIAENDAVAKRRIAMQEDFRAGENARCQREIKWMVGQIGVLAPAGGDAFQSGKKSRILAHGSFGYRRHSDSIEISDPKAALAFAVENNLPVKTTHSVSKTSLKDHAASTGEMEGDGWRHVEGAEEFFVKPAK